MSDDTSKNQQSWLDKHMQSLIGDGNVSHLGGPGKKLNLDENPYEPQTQRMANRLMKESNILPSWMQMKNELEEERDSILSRLARLARTYRGQLADADRAGNHSLAVEIEAWWKTACVRVREQISDHNRRILSYNISLPRGFDQWLPLQAEEEIRKALTRRDAGLDISLSS